MLSDKLLDSLSELLVPKRFGVIGHIIEGDQLMARPDGNRRVRTHEANHDFCLEI